MLLALCATCLCAGHQWIWNERHRPMTRSRVPVSCMLCCRKATLPKLLILSDVKTLTSNARLCRRAVREEHLCVTTGAWDGRPPLRSTRHLRPAFDDHNLSCQVSFSQFPACRGGRVVHRWSRSDKSRSHRTHRSHPYGCFSSDAFEVWPAWLCARGSESFRVRVVGAPQSGGNLRMASMCQRASRAYCSSSQEHVPEKP